MAALVWDRVGERFFETGVDHGVLYIPDEGGVYATGVAWNGLTTVTESPSGAEANAQWADNIKYLNLISAEEFAATLEAFSCPVEFYQFDGMANPIEGVSVGQQARKVFGLCYRTKVGNDLQGNKYGYKLHLVYGCQATPSEKAYGTINDTPEAIALSWSIATTPVNVTNLDPTSILTIDSKKVNAGNLADLETVLYGAEGIDPRLPLPDEVIAILTDGVTRITPTVPTSDGETITIPTQAHVEYVIDGEVIPAGPYPYLEDTVVSARPIDGYSFVTPVDNEWLFPYAP